MSAFSWSYTKLKNYRTCPKRHYHVELKKDFREEESDALKWGNEFHKAMERRIVKGEQLPLMMRRYEDWGWQVDEWKKQGEIKVEQQLAFDSQFRATNWRDNASWFRAKVDVMWMPERYPGEVVLLDWKTGDVKPDEQQLQLSAQAVFANTNSWHVVTSYIWIGNDCVTTRSYERHEMVGLWNGLFPEIKGMEEAMRTTTYPPKPSGLCKRHCPVTSCPYYGKGSY